MEIKKGEPLKQRNSWRVGGPADYFCEPESSRDMQEALFWAEKNRQPYSVLGGGSNILVSDRGAAGLVISTRRLNRFAIREESGRFVICAEAGLTKGDLMTAFRENQLAPAVFLSGLPGDLGGGIVMNAGVSRPLKPSEFSEITDWFDVITPRGERTYYKKDIKWEYRRTSGWERGVIFRAALSWPLEPQGELREAIKRELKRRKASQPLNHPCCGSVFKNPYPELAGRLIEKAGLKGLSEGGAFVSPKHANFIINGGGASARDIDRLIRKIQMEVQKQFQISLELEVRRFGRWERHLSGN